MYDRKAGGGGGGGGYGVTNGKGDDSRLEENFTQTFCDFGGPYFSDIPEND